MEWQLPDGAFVEYTRARTKFEFKGDRRVLYLGPDPAPGFYEYEVENQRSVEWLTSSLLDVGPLIAWSLSGWTPRAGQRSRVSRRFDRVQKFGSIRASGVFVTESVTDPRDVHQAGRIELKHAKSDFPNAIKNHWNPALLFGVFEPVDTVLTIKRRVDAIAHRVTSFEIDLAGGMARGDGEPRRFHVKETWEFVAVREPYHRGFQRRVNEAIRRGCAFLEKRLERWQKRGSLSRGRSNNRSYGTGRLALILLTLVKGNPYRDTPVIQRLLADLRTRDPIDTYSLGCSLMALEAYYGPANEHEQIRQGLIDRPAQRVLTPSDKKLAERWAKRILDNNDTRVDRGYLTRFNYVKGRRFDNSVTQYGVLGLHSAELCGVDIPFTAWLGLTEHYLSNQAKAETKPTPLRLRSYADLEREKRAKASGTGTVARQRRRRAPPRGFGYSNPKSPTGSMTCAGLTGLGICHGILFNEKSKVSRKNLPKVQQALLSAFSWLYDNFDVRSNPRHERRWLYYYLYGLERACEINGVARIHDRDWYYDGAMQLLPTQHKAGSWGTLQDTCFAVLFLKKAVAPAITGR